MNNQFIDVFYNYSTNNTPVIKVDPLLNNLTVLVQGEVATQTAIKHLSEQGIYTELYATPNKKPTAFRILKHNLSSELSRYLISLGFSIIGQSSNSLNALSRPL